MPTSEPIATPWRVKDRPTWLVSRLFARSLGLLKAGFEEHGAGLRGYHYRLLAAVEEMGPVSQADLGRSTGIDRSDVTAALADLDGRGLISRSVDPANRRRNVVTITPAGASELVRLDAVVDDVQEQLLAPLSDSQRRQFLTMVRRLLDS